MTEETIKAKEKFEEITGIKPMSLKKNTGSMKGYFTVTVPTSNEAVAEFIEGFYKTGANRVLNGVTVTFMGSRYREDRIRFDIRKSELA